MQDQYRKCGRCYHKVSKVFVTWLGYIRDRGRAAREENLLSTSFSGHKNNLATRRSSDDAVIDEQNILALEVCRLRVQLRPDTLLTELLGGHDERAEDVAVLNKALLVGLSKGLGNAEGSCHGSLRDGHDAVNISKAFGAQLLADRLGKLVSHVATALVHVDAVHDGIGTSKVDILENVRGVAELRVDLAENGALALFDDDRLTGQDVSEGLVAALSEGDGLGSHHVVSAVAGIRGLLANDHWADAMGVTETNKAKASKHGGTCPAANALLVHPAQSIEAVLGVDTGLAGLVELVGKNVQHQLAVTLRVDVTVSLLVEDALELGSVDEVAIVGQADSIWAVYVEGLGFRVGAAAGRGVSEVTETHETGEICDSGAVVEDLGGHAIALALVEAATRGAGGYSASILASVLEQIQGVVNLNGGGGGRRIRVDNGDDATHGC